MKYSVSIESRHIILVYKEYNLLMFSDKGVRYLCYSSSNFISDKRQKKDDTQKFLDVFYNLIS